MDTRWITKVEKKMRRRYDRPLDFPFFLAAEICKRNMRKEKKNSEEKKREKRVTVCNIHDSGSVSIPSGHDWGKIQRFKNEKENL